MENTEKIKHLVQLALNCGRHYQSPQTGYIHIYHSSQDEDPHQTIPIFENVLFCLSLLRSRTIEHVTEAKELLERLLHFQNKDQADLAYGNFPNYLHDYPNCRDHSLPIHLLPSFYWILKGFGHVIGGKLKAQIESAVKLLFAYCHARQGDFPLKYPLALKFGASQIAFGRYFGNKELEQRGDLIINELQKQQLAEIWNSTLHLSDLLVGLQMLFRQLSDSPWNPLWNYICETWHLESCQYIGPCIKEYQRKEEPEPNLYDLFLGYFSHRFSKRTENCRPYHLQAALIQPCHDLLTTLTFPLCVIGEYKGNCWELRQEKEWAYIFLQNKEQLNPTLQKSYTPFKFCWGDDKTSHSFVFQGNACSVDRYTIDENQISFILEFRALTEFEDIHKQREINFYLDRHESSRILIENQPSTTFQLGENIDIQCGKQHLLLQIELIKGEGQFTGHWMRGNRPSQLQLKGNDRFNAYDWQILLRTIRRTENCQFKVTLQIIP